MRYIKTKYRRLDEEGEDDSHDTDSDDNAKDDSSKEDTDDTDGSEESEDSSTEELPFSNLDMRKARCFGFFKNMSRSWNAIAFESLTIGWKNSDIEQLEHDLALNVDLSYVKIAEFDLVNLDDNIEYVVYFDNLHAMWQLEIKNSPKAELTIEERGDFFKSDMFKKIARRSHDLIASAMKTYRKVVVDHIENGELLEVDVVKLEALSYMIDTKYFMDNLLSGKYMDY